MLVGCHRGWGRGPVCTSAGRSSPCSLKKITCLFGCSIYSLVKMNTHITHTLWLTSCWQPCRWWPWPLGGDSARHQAEHLACTSLFNCHNNPDWARPEPRSFIQVTYVGAGAWGFEPSFISREWDTTAVEKSLTSCATTLASSPATMICFFRCPDATFCACFNVCVLWPSLRESNSQLL